MQLLVTVRSAKAPNNIFSRGNSYTPKYPATTGLKALLQRHQGSSNVSKRYHLICRSVRSSSDLIVRLAVLSRSHSRRQPRSRDVHQAFQILFRNAVLIQSQAVSIHAWSISIMGLWIHSTSRLNFNAVQIVEDVLGIFIPPRDHTAGPVFPDVNSE